MDDLANSEYEISVANCQSETPIDEDRLLQAVNCVLRGEQILRAEISVAIVDDEKMHELNRQYLDHDYPTDVLSFSLGNDPEFLEGEIIASSDTAVRMAREYGWEVMEEVCLYLIHGVLHLVGYDDSTADEQIQMRVLENQYLAQMGIFRSDTNKDVSP
ncbi:MAG: rRNA maturation RNase YbeY [Planctomycetota bacterium]|nr:rRNA maturation RNase YbeY [Planctomycetota bacterium]MDA1180054.1 rRNA maturation RNase YbeY [Planctomycetota bacterium]